MFTKRFEPMTAPKPLNYTALWVVGCISFFIAGMLVCAVIHRYDQQPNVDLPENYKSITLRDHLIGSYVSETNTLIIQVDNDQK